MRVHKRYLNGAVKAFTVLIHLRPHDLKRARRARRGATFKIKRWTTRAVFSVVPLSETFLSLLVGGAVWRS